MDQPNYPQSVNEPALPTSNLALISLIAGILGFTAVPLLGGIVALFTGYAARKETRAIPPKYSGDGLATAGIIMGWIQVGLTVVGICCVGAYLVFMVGVVNINP